MAIMLEIIKTYPSDHTEPIIQPKMNVTNSDKYAHKYTQRRSDNQNRIANDNCWTFVSCAWDRVPPDWSLTGTAAILTKLGDLSTKKSWTDRLGLNLEGDI